MAKMIETGVAQSRPSRSRWIEFLKIGEHRFDRRVQAVKIHSIESDRRTFRIELFVKATQPFHELQHDFVTPHPRCEPAKARKRFVCVRIRCRPADVTMDAT